VEDDPDLRAALGEVLRDEGYAVVGAAHGQEALSLLRQEPGRTSLILLDLTMPVMDGWQFRSEQRSDPDLATIPVVILSAAERRAEHLASLGIRDYVPKPIDLTHLLETIERCCGASEPEA
jgi:CheY-like chemotaxis protein